MIALVLLLLGADPAPCASPRQAAATIVGNLNKQDVPRALRCIEVPKGMQQKELLEKMRTLQGALDSAGVVVKPADIPDDPGYLDPQTFEAAFVLSPSLPRIRLARDERGDWKLPKDVVEDADEIAGNVSVSLDKWARGLGPNFQKRVFNTTVWQWCAVFVVVAVAMILRVLFEWMLRHKVGLLFAAIRLRHDVGDLKLAARPVGWMLACAFIALLIPPLSLPGVFTAFLLSVCKLVASLCVVWLAVRAVDVAAFHFEERARETDSKVDDHLVPLLRRIAKVVLFCIGAVVGLQVVGIDVGSLIAGLGIGGLAVALAAKDTIGNFFGSIAIFLDRPFQIGDWITTADGKVEGAVENIGFRSTQVRTIRDTVVTVPNAKMADAEVDNWGARRHRRLRLIVPFTLDASPLALDAFIAKLRASLLARPELRKEDIEVHLHELLDGQLQVLVHCYFSVDSWTAELKLRHAILADVVTLAKDEGLTLTAPTRALRFSDAA